MKKLFIILTLLAWLPLAHADQNAKEMTPADISKAQELAKRCIESNYEDCPE